MKTKGNLIQLCLLGAMLLQALTSKAQPVTKIAAGYAHSLFIKADGSLWGMGRNLEGQLGDGPNTPTNRPKQIVASNVTAIAAGNYYNLFLKRDGSLWVMGDNSDGQLGDGTYNNTNRPEQIVASNVTAIAAGPHGLFDHSLFLKSDGSLWAMGWNNEGELGDGTFGLPPGGEPISPSRLLPAMSRRLPPEAPTACCSRVTAVFGPWAITILAS